MLIIIIDTMLVINFRSIDKLANYIIIINDLINLLNIMNIILIPLSIL